MSRPKRLANGLASLPPGTDPEAVRFTEPTGAPVDLEQLATSSQPPAPAPANEVEEGPTTIGELPLFAGQSFESGNAPAGIRVTRVGPVTEGGLGTIDLNATEHDIRSKWGGGEYRLEVVNSRSFTIKGGTKTIKLAGEPLIQSELYRAEYESMVRNRNRGGAFNQQSAAPLPAQMPSPLAPLPTVVAPPSMDSGVLGVMLTFMQMQAESQRLAQQRENEAASQREAMQFRFFELFSRNNEKKQDTFDPIAQIERLFKLRKMIEGKPDAPSEPDATSKIIEAVPQIFSEVKELVQLERGRGGPPGAVTPAMVEAVLAQIAKSDDVLILEPPIGVAANKATKRLAEAGIDPAAVLLHFFSQLCELPMESIRLFLGVTETKNAPAAEAAPEPAKPAESPAQMPVPA